MFKIDTPGATADNKFTAGNPLIDLSATIVSDEWLTMVQEELNGALVAAGISPDKQQSGIETGDSTQLAAAITTIASNVIKLLIGTEITVLAPYDLSLGEPFVSADTFGIANAAALSGAPVTMTIRGRTLSAITVTTGETTTLAGQVYFNPTTKLLTTDPSAGKFAGVAVLPVTGPAQTKVIIGGIGATGGSTF
jgi:methylaspartate ammonia-lyase